MLIKCTDMKQGEVNLKGSKISTGFALHQQWPSQTGSSVCLQEGAGRAKQEKNQDDNFVSERLLRHTPRKTKTRPKQAQLVCLCLESRLNCCFAASPTCPCCCQMPHARSHPPCCVNQLLANVTVNSGKRLFVRVGGDKRWRQNFHTACSTKQ